MHRLAIIIVKPKKVVVFYDSGTTNPVLSVEHNEPKSLSVNFMLGVENTESKYIVRIDGDDNYPDMLKLFYAATMALACNPEVDAFSPIYKTIDGELITNKPQGAGILYKREDFLDVGGYDKTLDIQADLDFYIRFTKKYKMGLYSLVYIWNFIGGRSFKRKDELSRVRAEILKKHNLQDTDVHHFGAYAYIDD